MADVYAYRCIDGTVMRAGDSRLAGYGEPPSDPVWHADPKNAGLGRLPMTPELVPEAEVSQDPQVFHHGLRTQ